MVRPSLSHPPHFHRPVIVSRFARASACLAVAFLFIALVLAVFAPLAGAQDPSKVPTTTPGADKDGSAQGPPAMAPGRFLVGDAAPEVNLRDATGAKFQLSKAVKERAWLLVFARAPEDAIDLELAVPGLNALGIGSALIAPFGQDKLSASVSSPHFRLLPDRASRVARVYGQYDAVSSNPRQGIVLVDRRGKIRLVMSGGIPTSSEIVRLSREALEIAGELPVTG